MFTNQSHDGDTDRSLAKPPITWIIMVKVSTAPLSLLVCILLLSNYAAAEKHDDHDDHKEHDEHEECACVAAELGFTIDCQASAVVVEAYNNFQGAGCTSCSEATSPACYRNYVIVQVRHRFCHAQLCSLVLRCLFFLCLLCRPLTFSSCLPRPRLTTTTVALMRFRWSCAKATTTCWTSAPRA